MKVKTTFEVTLEREGEGKVTFHFRTPRLNEIQRDSLALKRLKGDDPTEAQMELISSIIDRCVSVVGLEDEDGQPLSSSDIGALPSSILSALIEAYQQGSAEAISKGKSMEIVSQESASA